MLAFNRRHTRVGHLYQGRYWAALVEKEVYFQTLLRYVVLNPVRANMVGHPGNYKWSSYQAMAGGACVPEWLAADEVLSQFSEDRQLAQARYRAFIDDVISSGANPWENLIGQIYLGTESWVEDVRDRVQSRLRDSEHPRLQREVGNPQMAVVIRSVAEGLGVEEAAVRDGRGGTPRLLAAWIGSRESLLGLPAVAAGLRLRSAGHVSELVKRCDQQLETNPMVQAGLDRCLRLLRSVGKTSEPKI